MSTTEMIYDVQECIARCRQCHDVCVQTLSYCLEQGGRHTRPEHIRLLFDCIDICQTSVAFMLRDSDLHHATCAACAEVCEWCAADCEKMADDDRMHTCAEVCRACAQSCREMSGVHFTAGSEADAMAQPSHEEIGAMAQRLHENDGLPPGRDEAYWLRAERILRRRREARARAEHRASMKLKQIMTDNIATVHPDAPVRGAAEIMRSRGIGALPVCDERCLGMITDRDIAVRVVAAGRNPDECKVREAMSPEVAFCYEDQDLAEAEEIMQEKQIRRLPVLNAERRLVGMVSLGDLATRTTTGEQHHVAITLESVSLS